MTHALPDNLPRDLAGAACAAGRVAAGPGDVPLDRIGAWVFGGGNSGRNAKRRFVNDVARLVTCDGAGWKRLPTDTEIDRGPFAGRTVGELVQQERPTPLPAGVKRGSEAEHQRWGAEETIRKWIADFRREHPRLGPSTQAFADEFGRVYGPALDQLRSETGFACRLGKTALHRIKSGKPTRWERSGQHRQELFDADLFNEAVSLYMHPHKFSVRGAYGIYAYCQARAARAGKLWAGSRNTFAARLKEAVPKPFRKLGQEGEWKYERDCVPKLIRQRDKFACGEAASLDGRDDDQLARIPDSRGGWKMIRPTEVVFFDVASGFPLGWHIAAHETADATLLALRDMHDRVGLPRYVETDNGRGFVCAFGSHGRRKWPADDVRRLHAMCEYVRIDVDHKVPRRAWAKTAETRFSRVKQIDRLSPYFIGGSPDERPEDVLRRVKGDIMQLPTLAEFRRQRETDYELYGNTPSPALGGLTPRQYFEVHRGETRKVDPEFLAFACSRLAGGRTGRLVRRDGVQYGGKGIFYGRTDEEVHKLQGRRVWLRVDPADLSVVWLCDERGVPLCLAAREDLAGATPEHLREVHQRLARMRKAARQFVADHSFYRGTAISQVRQVLSEHRRAEAAEYERTHAPPAPAPVQVIASEHIPAVRKAKAAARRQAVRRALQASAGQAPTGESKAAENPFDLLFTSLRDEPQTEAVECQADRLVRFGHAG